jgi:hypothetical protein
MAQARDEGWVAYPETGGCDILLVATKEAKAPGIEPGDQIAVEAKLRPNLDVLAQAVTGIHGDFRAVLVPRLTQAFRTVASALKVDVLVPLEEWERQYGWTHIRPSHLLRRRPAKRAELPPIVPMCPAGTPAPRQLTRWRVAALRLCLLLEERGYITSADFKAHGITLSRWHQSGWLRPDGRVGRLKRYVPGHNPLPIVGWEAEAAAIREADA